MSLDTVIDAQSLTDAAPVASSDIENDHARFADVEISWPSPAESPATSTVKLFVLAALDATNFEDGSPTVDPEEGTEVHTFMVRDEQIARRMTAKNIPIPASKYKYLLVRDTDKALTVTLKEQKQMP